MAVKDMETIVSLAKNRGFIYPGSEIYGGLANSWDYGPLGVELKNNIKQATAAQIAPSLILPERTIKVAGIGSNAIPIIPRNGTKTIKTKVKKVNKVSNAKFNLLILISFKLSKDIWYLRFHLSFIIRNKGNNPCSFYSHGYLFLMLYAIPCRSF